MNHQPRRGSPGNGQRSSPANSMRDDIPTIVLLPGDGIGPHVVEAAVKVLEAAGFEADYVQAEIGWTPWTREGNALPEETVQLLHRHGLALGGAITSRPQREALAALPADLARTVTSYESPILSLRRRLNLEVSIRPVGVFQRHESPEQATTQQAITTPVVTKQPETNTGTFPFGLRPLDMVVVMQNTEGHYAGLEWRAIQGPLARAVFSHRAIETNAMLAASLSRSERVALSARIVTEGACRRVSRAAFREATKRGYPRVILCDKWGVMQETASLFLEAAQQEAAHWPQVEFSWMNADAFLARVAQGKIDRAVILAGALIGDLISDALAGLAGGVALAACANVGPDAALFEPLHGSAPKYAACRPPIANPTGAILAGAMLAEQAGRPDLSQTVTRALAQVLRAGRHRTFDLMGLPGGPNVLDQGAASTERFTEAVIEALAGES